MIHFLKSVLIIGAILLSGVQAVQISDPASTFSAKNSKDGTLCYDGAIDSKPTTDKADLATADPLFVDALTAVIADGAVKNAKNHPYGCGVKY